MEGEDALEALVVCVCFFVGRGERTGKGVVLCFCFEGAEGQDGLVQQP